MENTGQPGHIRTPSPRPIPSEALRRLQDHPTLDPGLALDVAVEIAKATGNTNLFARRLASFIKCYGAMIGQGRQLDSLLTNRQTRMTGCGRSRLDTGPARDPSPEVRRFATDFTVTFETTKPNATYRWSAVWRSNTGADTFDVRSSLGTARHDGQSALSVRRDALAGQPTIPNGGHSPALARSWWDLYSYPLEF